MSNARFRTWLWPAAVLLALAAPLSGQAQSASTGPWPERAGATGLPSPIQAPAVGLQRRATADGVEVIAENHLDGPVDVRLSASRVLLGSDPALPVRVTLPAGARTVLVRLRDGDGGPAALQLQAVPGAPGARHRDVEYLYPLRGAPLRVSQGFGGGFSHLDDENRHAVDFAVDEGTPVIAARDGTVMQLEARIAGQAAADDGVAFTNFVRILHDDGTMALYAHLQRDGVIVTPGTHVRRGQIIAFSGNTGASTGPHLHFAIHANHDLKLMSVPFRMFGPGGILRFTAPER